MKRYLIVLCSLALILTSCGPNPITFNDTLVDYVDRAHNQTESLSEKINAAVELEDFKAVSGQTVSIVDSLNIYINAVNKLEVAKGGEDFKASVSEYLNSLVDMTKSYATLSDITEDTSDEQLATIEGSITQKEELADKLFTTLQTKQKGFAKANNIELKD